MQNVKTGLYEQDSTLSPQRDQKEDVALVILTELCDYLDQEMYSVASYSPNI